MKRILDSANGRIAFITVLTVMIAFFVTTSLTLATDDPEPSPLYQHSLKTSVERFDQQTIQQPVRIVKSGAGVEVAAVPHPDQHNPQGGGVAISSASQQNEQACFDISTSINLSFDPIPPQCELTSQPTDFAGTMVIDYPPPPYIGGADIPIQIVQLHLSSVAPTPVGDLEVDLNPGIPSQGAIRNVVTDPGGNLIGGSIEYQFFMHIFLQTTGDIFENRDPIPLQGPIGQLPPPPGTFIQSQPGAPPIPLFRLNSLPIDPPEWWVCEVLKILELECAIKKCVYQLTCVSGPADEMANLGLCVGDLRTGDDCPNNTCAVSFTTKVGNLCLVWTLVACEPSELPPFVGTPGVCECEPQPTMPSTPSCPGEASCPSYPSCGSSYYTCGAEGPSCPDYVSCQSFPTCPGSNSCESYPSCPGYPSCISYATCHEQSTCYGQPTCNSTPTCGGAVSCDQPDSFAVVFSVERDSLWAEGLLVPGHPEPNDVYALGPANGYGTFGELFQSSGASLGSPPDLTNLDRLSSALGVGPAPFGGPPFTGPFAPNTGAPAPVSSGFPGTFGLLRGDNINALSYGTDGGNVLLFSVDIGAVGRPSSALFFQSKLSPPAAPIGPTPPSNGGGDPGDEAAGDIFRSSVYKPFGGGTGPILTPAPFRTNALELDEVFLGLQAPAIAHSIAAYWGEDDLDALEAEDAISVDYNVDGIPDTMVYFSLDSASFQVIAPTADPFPGLSTGPDPDGVTPDDILVAPPLALPAFSYAIFARGVADIGLLPGDDLDALCLWDSSPRGVLNAGDVILFSLSLGSPSLVPGANPNMPPGFLAPGDVFFKALGVAGGITRYARSRSLGLRRWDELNALDIGYCDCTYDNNGDLVPDICQRGFVPPGRLVDVPVVDVADPCVVLTFDNIVSPGFSSIGLVAIDNSDDLAQELGLSALAPAALPCFPGGGGKSALQEVAYDITTDADYSDSITICFNYDESALTQPEDSIRVVHEEEVAPGDTQWVDVTVSVDTVLNEVCGRIGSFSKFAIAEPILDGGCSCPNHGDPAENGTTVDVFDVVAAVDVAFRSGTDTSTPDCTYTNSDVNCDSIVDVFDVVSFVDVAFRNGDAGVLFCNPCP